MTSDRAVFRITGKDRESFLQGLVTNDLRRLADGPIWAAMLTPQGKYLADFFLVGEEEEGILLDIHAGLADRFIGRLTMYKLRADVTITPAAVTVLQGPGTPPEGAVADPRHEALGWRLYAGKDGPAPASGSASFGAGEWDALRVRHCVPETLIELRPDETYILEAGFERLHGVDFRKGCYVGQEVTARMKHKTELRKGLVTVEIDGTAPVGSAITTLEGRAAGTLFTQSRGRAIAHLRFDRAGSELQAEGARIRWDGSQPGAG